VDDEQRQRLEELRAGIAELQLGIGQMIETIDVMLAAGEASGFGEIATAVEELGRGMDRLVRGFTTKPMGGATREALKTLAADIADQRAGLDELLASIESGLESGDAAQAKKIIEHVRAHAQVLIDAGKRLGAR
jgi:hypothetical protein